MRLKPSRVSLLFRSSRAFWWGRGPCAAHGARSSGSCALGRQEWLRVCQRYSALSYSPCSPSWHDRSSLGKRHNPNQCHAHLWINCVFSRF
ncbi:hypothetical protein K461DRAFT_99750 [Myriangium duriaei CBS 260.36]|uniref:Uncharacterized protein n=1 Tax=Myriangium duriaei CBS 260.36 TaxID=1168546 RepID=A0A9P4J3A0_9PEZI|nr:hypothetical protein K461DRAFT_99750 [Myriangium duriaei CBS 260.36]